jgi:hypothetical protein
MQGIVGIPKLYEYQSEGKYNFLIIEVLGKSIENYFKLHHRKFSISVGFALAEQMVNVAYSFIR